MLGSSQHVALPSERGQRKRRACNSRAPEIDWSSSYVAAPAGPRPAVTNLVSHRDDKGTTGISPLFCSFSSPSSSRIRRRLTETHVLPYVQHARIMYIRTYVRT